MPIEVRVIPFPEFERYIRFLLRAYTSEANKNIFKNFFYYGFKFNMIAKKD
jgi:hypothetical protein